MAAKKKVNAKKRTTDKELLNMHSKKLGKKANVSNKASKPQNKKKKNKGKK